MLLFVSLAVVLLNVLSLLISIVWYRMSAYYLALIPAASVGLPLGWGTVDLIRHRPWGLSV